MTVSPNCAAMDPRRLVAALPVCAALWIGAAPATAPPRAPTAPPDGTYVYALSRDGTDQGTATIVLTRRDDLGTFETNEVVAVGALRAQALASFRYEDFSIASYVATYQAPFPRDTTLGRGRSDFYAQTTVRYRFDGRDASATIDGVRGALAFARSNARVAHAWILDGPLMTGVLLLPAYKRNSNDNGLAAVSVAFPPAPVTGGTPQTDRTKPSSSKTPASDKTFGVAGLVRTWYRPGNDIVDEARDVAFNLDARLVSYVRTGTTASFVAQAAPAVPATPDATTVPLTTADGRSLTGALTVPANARRAPLVVLVPPGADATIDYGGAGPQPMFADLTRALVGRGFAVLRYATHGSGRGASTGPLPTWEASLAAARAAVGAARLTDGIDPARIYALGYATGADLALALGASDGTALAGIVALGPTTGTYRSCPSALAGEPGAWRASALGHDPAAFAARVRVPLLVLHPGVSMCGDATDAIGAYDATLPPARASAIVASDLSQRFGGRYDADSSADGEAIFPYRFDPSTASAIADWFAGPKASAVPTASPSARPIKAPPPPPPTLDGTRSGTANPHASPTAEPAPGVVLPSGEPTPVVGAPSTPSPSEAPSATPIPSVVPSAVPSALPSATVTPSAMPTRARS